MFAPFSLAFLRRVSYSPKAEEGRNETISSRSRTRSLIAPKWEMSMWWTRTVSRVLGLPPKIQTKAPIYATIDYRRMAIDDRADRQQQIVSPAGRQQTYTHSTHTTMGNGQMSWVHFSESRSHDWQPRSRSRSSVSSSTEAQWKLELSAAGAGLGVGAAGKRLS